MELAVSAARSLTIVLIAILVGILNLMVVETANAEIPTIYQLMPAHYAPKLL